MRKIIFFTLLVGIVFSNSGGPGTFQRRDRTGSPVAAFSTCADCHFGGSFQGKLKLELLKDSMEVDYYQPGEEYLLKVSIEASENAKEFGFQTVALIDSTFQNAGQFYELPEFIQKVELLNRTYVEHSRPLLEKIFYLGWKAPEEKVGDILMYAAGVATNNNNGTNGDQPLLMNEPLKISSQQLNSFQEFKEAWNLKIVENPVQHELIIEGSMSKQAKVYISIIDMRGKVIENYRYQWDGEIRENILVSHLQSGLYYLVCRTENSLVSFPWIKI